MSRKVFQAISALCLMLCSSALMAFEVFPEVSSDGVFTISTSPACDDYIQIYGGVSANSSLLATIGHGQEKTSHTFEGFPPGRHVIGIEHFYSSAQGGSSGIQPYELVVDRNHADAREGRFESTVYARQVTGEADHDRYASVAVSLPPSFKRASAFTHGQTISSWYEKDGGSPVYFNQVTLGCETPPTEFLVQGLTEGRYIFHAQVCGSVNGGGGCGLATEAELDVKVAGSPSAQALWYVTDVGQEPVALPEVSLEMVNKSNDIAELTWNLETVDDVLGSPWVLYPLFTGLPVGIELPQTDYESSTKEGTKVVQSFNARSGRITFPIHDWRGDSITILPCTSSFWEQPTCHDDRKITASLNRGINFGSLNPLVTMALVEGSSPAQLSQSLTFDVMAKDLGAFLTPTSAENIDRVDEYSTYP